MIKTEILLDSINTANGSRLTTWILEYPRMVHAEFMTHRMFSKNAASSRAIPIEKMIQQVLDNPAMPEFWGKNQSGMQAIEELDDINKKHRLKPWHEVAYSDKELAMIEWLKARDSAVEHVKTLNKMGVHKQIANRILEPWFHIKIIMTATEMENFFALRAHKDAQPEIRVLAEKMLKNYNESIPKKLNPGEWHVPFGDRVNHSRLWHDLGKPEGADGDKDYYIDEALKKIAVARCARISYLNFEGKDDYKADINLCERLFGNIPKHLSPTEHVAKAEESNEFFANFKGFKQYRKFFVDENLKDGRVLKK